MPQLSGDIGFMPCRDLFLYLGNRRLSGTLEARRASVRKTVAIADGAAVFASSTDPREYLGQILINAGHLTEDEFNRAYETQRETKVPLGKILTMIGLVSEDVVKLALQSKIRETALDVCTWREGSFGFASSIPEGDPGVLVPMPLFELCREAETREAQWARIREVLPSGNVRLSLVPGAAVPSFAPTSLEGRLLPLLREGRSIEEMLLHLHSTEFILYQRLFSLMNQGMVEVARAGSREMLGDPGDWFPDATQPGPEPQSEGPSTDRLGAAVSALARGDATGAERLARRAAQDGAGDAVRTVLEDAEAALLAQLRADLLSVPRLPAVQVDRARIRAMPLSPPERYLLARMDGTRDLASIVRVSPLRELDALKLVKHLLDGGLIALQ